jgi:hypothetical protein
MRCRARGGQADGPARSSKRSASERDGLSISLSHFPAAQAREQWLFTLRTVSCHPGTVPLAQPLRPICALQMEETSRNLLSRLAERLSSRWIVRLVGPAPDTIFFHLVDKRFAVNAEQFGRMNQNAGRTPQCLADGAGLHLFEV